MSKQAVGGRAAATICPRPELQVMTRCTSCTHMERWLLLYVHVGLPGCQYNRPKRPGDLDLWLLTLEVVSESRVTWAISANFGLPRPLCSRLRPDVRDRQTDRRQTASSLNAPA